MWGDRAPGTGVVRALAAPHSGLPWLAFLFLELMESLRQAEQRNWTLDQHHIANLCDSLNHFLTQTGHMPPQGGSHRPPAPSRITDSCALTSGKPEPSMNQGKMQSWQRSGDWTKWRVKGREREMPISFLGSDPAESRDQLVDWIKDFCRSRRLSSFYTSIWKIRITFWKERGLVKESPYSKLSP